jgi:hypothetical protein
MKLGYVYRPLLSPPGQKSGFDFRRYQIFCEVVGLEYSLVSTTDELFGREISGSGLENREYGRRYPSCLSPTANYNISTERPPIVGEVSVNFCG